MRQDDHQESKSAEVQVGATTWKVRSSGSLNAPVIVLLGHVPDVSWSLDSLHGCLAAHFRVLQPERLDLPEGGDAKTFRQMAASVAALIETVATSRVTVAGYGFGGTVATYLGSMRKDLVRAVCTINTEHPDVYRVDQELAGQMADAYAYVADFLGPDFKQQTAADDYGLLTQFWQHEPWWPEHRERYLEEYANKTFLDRVARTYRANFRWVETEGVFTEEDAERRSAFGRACAAVQVGEPRRAVAPVEDPEPVLLEIPTLMVFSSKAGALERAHGHEALNRFVAHPRIVTWPTRGHGVHHSHPEELAGLIDAFHRDVESHHALAKEAPPDLARDRRDSQHLVDSYDTKIRDFRCPAIDKATCAMRGSHPKTHGVVHSTFIVAPDVPPELQLGLFTEPGAEFECMMRFSSLGKPVLEVFHDGDRDVRGVGIKVLEPGTSNTLNDFLLNTVPILSTKNGRDVVPQNLDFMNLEHLLDYADELVVPHVLEVSYYSQTPYRFGPRRAVKYRVRPQPLPDDLANDDVDREDPVFLRRRLEHALSRAKGDVVFDFMVQFQTDPEHDPIEDPRVEWRGEYLKVGEIRIPPQEVNAAENAIRDEAISFHLYHCLAEHAPLGAVNRSRRAVYYSSPDLRRELNEAPKNLYPYEPAPHEVCVIGSGVAGMSAALALSENGHRVTVVERGAQIGGHACSIDIGDGHSGDPAFGSFTGGAYPNVQRLMHKLNVEYEEHGAFKDALSYYSFDRQQYWKQIEDIPHSRHIFDEVARFDAWGILADESYDYVTAREYFEAEGFSEEFIHQYFLGSVIFVFVGHPANYYLDYPIRQLVKYSYMPVVLDSREPVCRVKLGSGYYMKRFREVLEGHGVRFLTSTETSVVERLPSGVKVAFRRRGPGSSQEEGEIESFDELVLAIQPPNALKVLGSHADAEEQEILGGFQVTHDTAVVHRDTKCMPEHREQWRHGNKAVPDFDEDVDRERPFIFTKWAMCNNDRKTDVFSTYAYNRDLQIQGGKRATFDHVKVTPEVVRLRKRILNRQGLGSVWYCGSWLRAFTLHEDGLVTGLRAANGILAGMKEYPIVKPYEISPARKRVPWGETHTFPDVLAYQAQIRGAKMSMTFVDDQGDEVASLTFGQLYQEAKKLAGNLRGELGVEAGDRVLLIYLPGIEFVVGFVGTILAGAVPVPAYPPNPRNLSADLRKINAIVESSGARIALTTREYRRMSRLGSVLSPTAMFKWPRQLKWHNVDDLGEPSVEAPRVEAKPDDLAFLQYTSGSTAEPKGVMITHGNLMHQLAIASEALGFSHETVGVCWVPQYHDLGLVGSILNSLYSGASYVFTSPVSFLKRPALWGEMMHRYKATATAAPDFGYRLLLRKTTPEQRQAWDWGSLEIAMSAGEAVDYDTMNGFNEAFACTGIHPQIFSPAYGLAEHVVAVSMGGERLFHIDKSELQLRNQIRFGSHRVVGCGKPPDSVAVAIVDPETQQRTGRDEVGEIWVSSPSKAAGYWQLPELTQEIFEAKLAGGDLDEQDAARTWLRTGDLGFLHHGEVFVTGRSKDLIILRGRNVYPVDLEKTAERVSKELRPGCSAAFGIGNASGNGHSGNGHSGNGHSGNGHDDEALAICVEVRNKGLSKAKLSALVPRIRKEIMASEGVHIGTVALLEPRSIPKTTSGKVKRRECQRQWFAKELKTVYVDEQQIGKGAVPTGPQVAVQSSVESVLHAAVFEVTRLDVEHDVPLSDQVDLDSVEFLELVGIITQRLAVDLPITSLTQYPTISTLAGYIRGLPDVRLPDPRVVTLNPETNGDAGSPQAESLFLVHPARGGIECFLELAKQWQNPLYAFRQVEPSPTLEDLAEAYIAAMKSVRPEGPYLLGGYSFGATVSREMARLLTARGESVSGLVLIDEIHRSPAKILDCPQGEEIGIFLSVCEEYLSAQEVDQIRKSLAASNGSGVSLDEALRLVADPDIQTAIAEQLETYSRNVRLLEGYEPTPEAAPRTVLVRAEESYNRRLDSFDRVITVPGGHSSMLYPPHVEPLSRGVQEAVEYCASLPTSAN